MTLGRKKMSKKDYKFTESEIKFGVERVFLKGTLTLPKKKGKLPCVILLSGYGPNKRDYETQGFKRYQVLAHKLAKKGFASLRYDDRGSVELSEIKWSDATFNDLTDEALEALKLLKKRSDIDSKRIGYLGHSLGATIATLAASKSEEVAFIIPIGGHGLIGHETALISRTFMSFKLGESEKESVEGAELFVKMIRAIQGHEDWEEVKIEVIGKLSNKFFKMTDEKRAQFDALENYINSTYEGFLIFQGKTPMYEFFLKFDPREAYEKVKCPVLLVFGESDLMHPPELHKEKIESALKKGRNKDCTSMMFPNANHDFFTEETVKKNQFIPSFLDNIIKWLEEKTS